MSPVNRKPFRKHIASELESALVGVGKPAQVVYPYQISDFNHQFPVVTVSAASSEHPNTTLYGEEGAVFDFAIDVFVAYSLEKEGWTALNSEDELDDIEQIVADWVCQKGGSKTKDPLTGVGWTSLAYAGRTDSTIPLIDIGGGVYRQERIILRVDIQGAL